MSSELGPAALPELLLLMLLGKRDRLLDKGEEDGCCGSIDGDLCVVRCSIGSNPTTGRLPERALAAEGAASSERYLWRSSRSACCMASYLRRS